MICPALGSRNFVKRLKTVVLPAPFGPISAWIVPRRILRSTPCTALKPRNSLVRPRVSRIASSTREAPATRPKRAGVVIVAPPTLMRKMDDRQPGNRIVDCFSSLKLTDATLSAYRLKQGLHTEPGILDDEVAPKQPQAEPLDSGLQAGPLPETFFGMKAQEHKPPHRHLRAEHGRGSSRSIRSAQSSPPSRSVMLAATAFGGRACLLIPQLCDLVNVKGAHLDADSASAKRAAEFRCRSVAKRLPAPKISAVAGVARSTFKELI